jgi:predicted thioesterase
MKNDLKLGAAARRTLTVNIDRTVDFLGEALRIYATPELVRDVEQTCLDFLLAYADDGENSVGAEIALKHGGATLLGRQVEIHVCVSAIEGRNVSFDFMVQEDGKEVASGTHRRFVVNVERLRAKVQGSRAQPIAAAP